MTPHHPPSPATSHPTADRPGGTALTDGSVFTDDSATTSARLYGRPERLHQRTSALHQAKICGSDVAATIADLAARHAPATGNPSGIRRVVDIGCGRGTTSRHLAHRLHPARLLLVDRSAPLLATAHHRAETTRLNPPVALAMLQADFHHLPLPEACIDVAVAAFCLYHSTRPHAVTAEIARVLGPQGLAVLATKSQDSYHELDHLVTDTGLDPGTGTRTSLYATFHSDNAAAIAASALDVQDVIHEPHVFRFTSHMQIAAYLATTPKYDLPARAGTPEAIAAELGRRRAPMTLTMTSTVTYVIARKPR